MTDENTKKLQDGFVKLLKSWGITDIKDIPLEYRPKKEYKDIWIIK